MNQSPCTPTRLILASLAVLLFLLPSTVGAQCTSGVANDDVDLAVRNFGWTYIFEDTLLIRSGNSFLIDCDAHLQTLEATIRLPGYVDDGIESLAAGDLVRCEIFDGDKNLIMSEVLSIPDEGYIPKLQFDFSDREFRLAAGLFYYMLTPVEKRWGWMNLGSDFDDGAYQQDFYGTWGEQTSDAMFNISWDPTNTFVATDRSRWGSLKAKYR